jgi:hypothetical protein
VALEGVHALDVRVDERGEVLAGTGEAHLQHLVLASVWEKSEQTVKMLLISAVHRRRIIGNLFHAG